MQGRELDGKIEIAQDFQLRSVITIQMEKKKKKKY